LATIFNFAAYICSSIVNGLLAAFSALSFFAYSILSLRSYFSFAISSALLGLGALGSATAADDPRPAFSTVSFSLSEANRRKSYTSNLPSALIF